MRAVWEMVQWTDFSDERAARFSARPEAKQKKGAPWAPFPLPHPR